MSKKYSNYLKKNNYYTNNYFLFCYSFAFTLLFSFLIKSITVFYIITETKVK